MAAVAIAMPADANPGAGTGPDRPATRTSISLSPSRSVRDDDNGGGEKSNEFERGRVSPPSPISGPARQVWTLHTLPSGVAPQSAISVTPQPPAIVLEPAGLAPQAVTPAAAGPGPSVTIAMAPLLRRATTTNVSPTGRHQPQNHVLLTDVLRGVLKYSVLDDLWSQMTVCKAWHRVTLSSSAWTSIFTTPFGDHLSAVVAHWLHTHPNTYTNKTFDPNARYPNDPALPRLGARWFAYLHFTNALREWMTAHGLPVAVDTYCADNHRAPFAVTTRMYVGFGYHTALCAPGPLWSDPALKERRDACDAQWWKPPLRVSHLNATADAMRRDELLHNAHGSAADHHLQQHVNAVVGGGVAPRLANRAAAAQQAAGNAAINAQAGAAAVAGAAAAVPPAGGAVAGAAAPAPAAPAAPELDFARFGAAFVQEHSLWRSQDHQWHAFSPGFRRDHLCIYLPAPYTRRPRAATQQYSLPQRLPHEPLRYPDMTAYHPSLALPLHMRMLSTTGTGRAEPPTRILHPSTGSSAVGAGTATTDGSGLGGRSLQPFTGSAAVGIDIKHSGGSAGDGAADTSAVAEATGVNAVSLPNMPMVAADDKTTTAHDSSSAEGATPTTPPDAVYDVHSTRQLTTSITRHGVVEPEPWYDTHHHLGVALDEHDRVRARRERYYDRDRADGFWWRGSHRAVIPDPVPYWADHTRADGLWTSISDIAWTLSDDRAQLRDFTARYGLRVGVGHAAVGQYDAHPGPQGVPLFAYVPVDKDVVPNAYAAMSSDACRRLFVQLRQQLHCIIARDYTERYEVAHVLRDTTGPLKQVQASRSAAHSNLAVLWLAFFALCGVALRLDYPHAFGVPQPVDATDTPEFGSWSRLVSWLPLAVPVWLMCLVYAYWFVVHSLPSNVVHAHTWSRFWLLRSAHIVPAERAAITRQRHWTLTAHNAVIDTGQLLLCVALALLPLAVADVGLGVSTTAKVMSGLVNASLAMGWIWVLVLAYAIHFTTRHNRCAEWSEIVVHPDCVHHLHTIYAPIILAVHAQCISLSVRACSGDPTNALGGQPLWLWLCTPAWIVCGGVWLVSFAVTWIVPEVFWVQVKCGMRQHRLDLRAWKWSFGVWCVSSMYTASLVCLVAAADGLLVLPAQWGVLVCLAPWLVLALGAAAYVLKHSYFVFWRELDIPNEL